MNKRTRQIMLATVGLLMLIVLQFFFSPSRVPSTAAVTNGNESFSFARERIDHAYVGRERPQR